MGDSDSIAKRKFEVERVTPFVFVIAYSPDSVNENKLLFELADITSPAIWCATLTSP